MLPFIPIFFYVLTFAECALYLQVFPSETSVANGEGLILQVLPLDGPLDYCSVRFNGQTLALIPGGKPIQSVSYWGGGLKKGECGAIVESFNSSQHVSTWVFQLGFSIGANKTATATVTALDTGKYQENITITGELGSELVIKCEGEDLWYCILTNPENQMVHSGNNCTQRIESLRVKDVGQWKCAVGLSKAIQEQVTYINVTVLSIKTLDIGTDETEKTLNIYCNHMNQNLNYCRFERPDGRAFNLEEGNSLGRYAYFGRGITENECGISIGKPLDSKDYGTWMCTLGLVENGRSGGFVTVTQKSTSKDLLLPKEREAEESLFVLTGSSLTLSCAVNTALNYCWFKHPNGTRYNPRPEVNESSWKYDGDSLLLGKCGMTLLKAHVSDSGTWLCGMGVQNEMQATKDLQKTFSVTVAEIPFIENRTNSVAMTGDWVILGCHSLQGEALQYCSFLAPNGTGYNLTPGQEKGRYSYYGSGLEYGQCGLMINPVKKEDYGMWQCGTLLAKKDGSTFVRNLYLEQPGILSSSVVGLIIGIILAMLVIAGYIFHLKKKAKLQRNLRQDIGQHTRPVALSMLSASSDETEMDVTTQPSSQ